jgi:hypothetical protein
VRSSLRTLVLGLIGWGCATAGLIVRADDDRPAEKPKTPEKAAVPALKLIPATRTAAPEKKTAPAGTHEQVREIVVKPENGNSLQTICPGSDGQILALVAPPRYGAAPKDDIQSEVRVFDADGQPQTKWTVKFVAQSLNTGPDGSVFVAGSARIAKFSKDGKLVAEAEVPHLAKVLSDTETLRKKAEEQLQDQVKSFDDMVKNMKSQKEALEKKDAEELTKAEKQQLKAIEANIKAYEQMADQFKKRSVNDVVAELTSRLRVMNAVAADDKDVYVACGELKGYGYAVWRMDHAFQNPVQIAKGLSGCCGQMDIQCANGEVLVAENSRHRVVRYDRDGKKIGVFGKAGREGEADCFGSCCNPMNLRVTSQGIYTAESEGHVKLFSSAGEFTGPVGMVKITGGCKNVGIAVSSDGGKVYFCDQPGGKILIMSRKIGAKSAE